MLLLLCLAACGAEESPKDEERKFVWYGEDGPIDKSIGNTLGEPDNRAYRVCLTNAGNDLGETQDAEPKDWRLFYPGFWANFAAIRGMLRNTWGTSLAEGFMVYGRHSPAPFHCEWPSTLPNTPWANTYSDYVLLPEYASDDGSFFTTLQLLSCGGFSCTSKGTRVLLNTTTISAKVTQWGTSFKNVRTWLYCRTQGLVSGLNTSNTTNSCMGAVPTNATQLQARLVYSAQDIADMVNNYGAQPPAYTTPQQEQ